MKIRLLAIGFLFFSASVSAKLVKLDESGGLEDWVAIQLGQKKG